MGAVAECQQGRRGVLSADNNFAKEGEEVRLVEMNYDVVAPSARASSDVDSFLKKETNSALKSLSGKIKNSPMIFTRLDLILEQDILQLCAQ